MMGGYVGRFAPSPTGPLHFGSLLSAVASYLQAVANNGEWLIRIEDIDPPRETPGASEEILAALDAYGFRASKPPIFQSNSRDLHERAITTLLDSGAAYRCSCSRKTLASAADGPLGKIYPGTCRELEVDGESAVRIRTDDAPVEFDDGLQGKQSQRLESESGDFIIRRRDGLIAYHLAAAVDDSGHNMTEVVRGIDLMDSTPRQLHVQNMLQLPSPAYLHIPVAVNAQGQKLSKLHGSPAIPLEQPGPVLYDALSALRQSPPESLRDASIDSIWDWAAQHWNVQRLAAKSTLTDVPKALA